MSVYNKLLSRFERDIQVKSNHNSRTVIDIFDRAYLDTVDKCGSIPDGKEIRELFVNRVGQKAGWGCRQVTYVLKDIVMGVICDS